ncbi:MAG: hypothetical protein ACRC3J_05790 [Culicoidibacterales bacterium]
MNKVLVILCFLSLGAVDVHHRLNDIKRPSLSEYELQVLSDELEKFADLYQCEGIFIEKSDENKLEFSCIKPNTDV